MARNLSTGKPAASVDTSWKATAFLNIYLPSKDGSKRKLGAIGLKASKDSEAVLIEWLKADPSRASKIASQVIMDFQMAQSSEANGFVLPD